MDLKFSKIKKTDMNSFDLHHSGTQFFLRNDDIIFDPSIRQLHSPGGGKHPKSQFVFRFVQRPQKNSQCADVRFNVRRKAVSARTLKI